MNAFFKVKVGYWENNSEHAGVVTGTDEGDMMNKVMNFYGHENVEQVTFWFGENYDSDVIELEDFKECPLFDLENNF